ncbi:hypothetical protein E2C01_038169 [Portunus trituberculatus]|uniref:Uncharacterized protein n=1 Tax=Portunus trituberculatus TaxID=210409 RepID=A0A5B7FGJ2_PORTR|nr:hypothetical protein [Portunus trituberculatus]
MQLVSLPYHSVRATGRPLLLLSLQAIADPPTLSRQTTGASSQPPSKQLISPISLPSTVSNCCRSLPPLPTTPPPTIPTHLALPLPVHFPFLPLHPLQRRQRQTPKATLCRLQVSISRNISAT